MKRNDADQSGKNGQGGTGFNNGCLASCRGVLARIAGAKEAIFHESFKALRAHGHLLRLVLNEAEAAAWQTMYPHLVFPTLATEKVQGVIAWDAKRQALQRGRRPF
jgi:hypothetical protein